MTYNNYKELEGRTLRRGDMVLFHSAGGTCLRYEVCGTGRTHLSTEGRGNDAVFREFKLNLYKYRDMGIGGGIFPYCRDMYHLTDLVLEIYKDIGPNTNSWSGTKIKFNFINTDRE